MFGLFEFGKVDEKKDVIIDETGSEIMTSFKRFDNNPILVPDPKVPWKARAVYNPAAIYLDRKVHLIYRGQSNEGVSSFGYASSEDGFNITEDLVDPIYRPSADFEMQTKGGWNSGCEDPRITKIGDRLYMTYAAYDGTNPPRVALTSIAENDFLNKNFLWDAPKLISPPGVDDKDSCIIKNDRLGLVAFHRLGHAMWIDKLKNLDFPDIKFLTGGILATARTDKWDNVKIGLAAPPIDTDDGLLLLYHGVSNPGFSYKIGAMLLDYNDPHKVLGRSNEPLLSPDMNYETDGQIQNIVFSCGAVVIDGTIFMYYGGADTVTGVSTMKLKSLLDLLLNRV